MSNGWIQLHILGRVRRLVLWVVNQRTTKVWLMGGVLLGEEDRLRGVVGDLNAPVVDVPHGLHFCAACTSLLSPPLLPQPVYLPHPRHHPKHVPSVVVAGCAPSVVVASCPSVVVAGCALGNNVSSPIPLYPRGRPPVRPPGPVSDELLDGVLLIADHRMSLRVVPEEPERTWDG